MSQPEQIRIEQSDHVATIILNRPDRLNAWTGQMASELRAAIIAAGNDPQVRCIVLTGAGRGFCAGADMAGLQEIAPDGRGSASNDDTGEDLDALFPDAPGPRLSTHFAGRFGYFYACPKPIIAAINGPCAGIGLILTLYADLRYAAEDAKFTTAFAERGLIAEHGISWLLPRLVGEANALDLLMSARKFRGDEAAQLGLVNAAFSGEALMDRVGEASARFSHDVSPRSVAVMKRQIRAAHLQDFATALKLADDAMAESFSAPDFKEGVASFVERRAPAFAGVPAASRD